MNKEDAEIIVAQLQQAHRISVGFYRRILPTIDAVANQLGLNFWRWDTIDTHVACNRKTQPSTKSAWDFVPLFASEHVYCRVNQKKKTTPNDIGVTFYLCVEDSFMPDNRAISRHPDPIDMPQGKALFQAFVYRPKDEYRKPFEDLWAEYEEESLEIGATKWKSVNDYFEGVAFSWLLADVICDVEPMVATLKKYIPPIDD